MHALAVQLAPVLAAEKSKVPFYIAGGLLVVWALAVSLGVGLRRPDFPANAGQQKAIMGVTAVLVLAAVSMAIVTSGGHPAAAPAAASAGTAPAASTPAPAATSTAAPSTTTPTTTPAPTTSTTSPPPAAGAAKLKLAANAEGQLSYDTKSLRAKAGSVTVTLANGSPIEHNVTIAQGTKVLGATPTFIGGSKSVKVSLKPGQYTFYCSVPGHRQAGMEGTLTVS